MGFAQERDDVEVSLASLVQEDSRDPGDDPFLEDRDVVLADHVHGLIRRTDSVDLDLPVSIVLAGVDNESLWAYEEVAPGVLRPIEDGRGDPFDQVRWRLEFGDEDDNLVAVVHLRPR